MQVITNYEPIRNDIYDIVKLFFPEAEPDLTITHTLTKTDTRANNVCMVEGEKQTKCEIEKLIPLFDDAVTEKKILKRYAKLAIYEALAKYVNKNLPWGSLTGIRPTKLAHDLISQGVEPYLVGETLMKTFQVSVPKANLVANILANQTCIIRNDNLVDLYINIPICPSRCQYCSFISSELEKVKDILPNYLDALIKEIRAVKEIISNKAYVVRTTYIGGGTPTSLTAEQLDLLLSEITYPLAEFTVECGRPDTITKEKLDVLKSHNVTRICINPQTFNQKTLKVIGRNHTIKDILDAYSLALNYNFTVNMDFIAGLPGEKFSHFKKTIDTALELYPQNLTVHTLSVKQGSNMSIEEINMQDKEVVKMIDYSYSALTKAGYKPYYMYRQKNQVSALENVGYTLPGKACIFNIDSMEETATIIACGANAVSKRVFNLEDRIEREANHKFIEDYITNIDLMIERKKMFFK